MSDVNVFVSAIEELVAEYQECDETIETANKRKIEIEASLSRASELVAKIVLDRLPAAAARQPDPLRSEAMKRAWATRRAAAAAAGGDGAAVTE